MCSRTLSLSLLALAVSSTLLSGCGRGELKRLTGFVAGADAEPDDGAGPTDGPDSGLRPDRAPGPDRIIGPDRSPADDGSGPLDTGIQCITPLDCFETRGVPPPCPAGPGEWQCVSNTCVPACAPPPTCRTDCDCPFELSCAEGSCQRINRPNLCCANPMCPPGNRCVDENGRPGSCGEPDAGLSDTGPRPDFGVRDVGVGTDGGQGQTCSNDCDCAEPLGCSRRGRCEPGRRLNQCCTAAICPAGNACVVPGGGMGTCPGGTAVPVGSACTGASCGVGGFCLEEVTGFPGGYCSAGCDPVTPCPAGSSCRDFGQGGGGGQSAFCLDECASAADCRPDYNCVQLGASVGRVCWPRPPASTNPMGTPVGSACTQDQDCAANLTCLGAEANFPDGYCSLLYCDPTTNPCPTASQCYAFPGLFSLCLEPCPNGGAQSTCRAGYYCLGPTGQPGVCIGT